MKAVIIALILCAPAIASAQDVTLQGYTDDGRFVVKVEDGIAAWQTEWQAGQSGEFWGVCTPQPLADADPFGEGACQVCSDAASCGLSKDASAQKPAKKSPNKKVKPKDKRKCVKDPDADVTGKSCSRTLSFGKAGKVSFPEGWSGDKAIVKYYFRPDSKAALVTMIVCGRMDGVCWPEMFALDLGGGAPGSHYDVYADYPEDGGTPTVTVTVLTDGKSREVPIEALETDGSIVFDAMQSPILDESFPEDTGVAIVGNIPRGTAAIKGFVTKDGFRIYAVHDGVVTRQIWRRGAAKPDGTKDFPL